MAFSRNDKTDMEIGAAEHQLHSCWETIKHKLHEEMTQEECIQMYSLMKNNFGASVGGLDDQLLESPEDLLSVLELTLTDWEAMQLLADVMKIMAYHVDMGSTKMADYIRAEQTRYLEIKRKFNIPLSDVFVGRARDIDIVYEQLINSNHQGAWLSGLGGMGKTTLTKELCQRLERLSAWTVFIADVRDRSFVRGLAYGILEALDCPINAKDDINVTGLVLAKTRDLPPNSLLVLDNIDSVLRNEGQTLSSYLHDIVSPCRELYLLVTAREDMPTCPKEHTSSFYRHRVHELSQADSVLLLKKKTRSMQFSDDIYERLSSHCGGCPLDILLVARTLNTCPSSLETLLQSGLGRNEQGLEGKIGVAFQQLTPEYQKVLVGLALFDTVPFSLDDVVMLLGVSSEIALTYTMNLRIRHFLECSGANEIADTNVMFFFHERVVMFLKKTTPGPELEIIFRFQTRMFGRLRMINDEIRQDFANGVKKAQKLSHFFRHGNTALYTGTRSDSPHDLPLSLHHADALQEVSSILQPSPATRRTMWQGIVEASSRQPTIQTYAKIQLARTYIDDRDFENAIKTLSESMEEAIMGVSVPNEDERMLRVEFCTVKGKLSQNRRDFVGALEYFNAAMRCLTSNPVRDDFTVRSISVVDNLRGTVFYSLGNMDEALQAHTAAYNNFSDYFRTHCHALLSTYKTNIGSISFVKGLELLDKDEKEKAYEQFNLALSACDESVAMSCSLKLEKSLSYTKTLLIRSSILERMGKIDPRHFSEATKDAAQALEINKQTLICPHIETARCYGQLACIKLQNHIQESKAGHNVKAKELLKEAIQKFQELEDYILKNGLERADSDEEDVMHPIFKHYRRAVKAIKQQEEIEAVDSFINNFNRGTLKYDISSEEDESDTSTTSSSSGPEGPGDTWVKPEGAAGEDLNGVGEKCDVYDPTVKENQKMGKRKPSDSSSD